MLKTFESVYLIVSIATLLISIIIFFRWWRMTSDIRDIRDQLLKGDPLSKVNEDAVFYNSDNDSQNSVADNSELMDKLIPKLKKNQCIVLVRATSKVEIWNKSDWDEIIEKGRANLFQRLYNNYDLE